MAKHIPSAKFTEKKPLQKKRAATNVVVDIVKPTLMRARQAWKSRDINVEKVRILSILTIKIF